MPTTHGTAAILLVRALFSYFLAAARTTTMLDAYSFPVQCDNYNAVTMQRIVIQYNAMTRIELFLIYFQCSTPITMQLQRNCNTIQCDTMQCNKSYQTDAYSFPIQYTSYNAITVQYSVIQCSAINRIKLLLTHFQYSTPVTMQSQYNTV